MKGKLCILVCIFFWWGIIIRIVWRVGYRDWDLSRCIMFGIDEVENYKLFVILLDLVMLFMVVENIKINDLVNLLKVCEYIYEIVIMMSEYKNM